MKKTFTKIFSICLAVVMMLCAFSAQAASKIDYDAALKAARKCVPSGSKVVDYEWDKEDNEWDFEFVTKDKKRDYDVKVNGTSGKVKEADMEVRHVKKTKTYKISKKKAQSIVKKYFKNVTIKSTKKATDDGCKVYKVRFTTPKYKGKAHVHGKTGKVIEWEKDFY